LASYFAVVVPTIEALGSQARPHIAQISPQLERATRRDATGIPDVYALLDAALGKLLQSTLGARPAAYSLRTRRDRHPQGGEPNPRIPVQEPERPRPPA